MRTELRAGFQGLALDGAEDLLDRLLQVRVEDYDGRGGWRPFDDARRRLRRAQTLGERREAAAELVEHGIELLGAPIAQGVEPHEEIEVAAGEIQLVAYEALVEAAPPAPAVAPESPGRLFDVPGDQLAVE